MNLRNSEEVKSSGFIDCVENPQLGRERSARVLLLSSKILWFLSQSFILKCLSDSFESVSNFVFTV